jgi:Leucine-rich repeat (LRR) protein
MNTRRGRFIRTSGVALLTLALCLTNLAGSLPWAASVTIAADTDGRGSRTAAPQSGQDEISSVSAETPEERAALMALYYSTYGGNWYNNSGWNTDDPYCEWLGVTCDLEGRVTVLSLGFNRLAGSLPPEIGDLQNLQELSLGMNDLSDSIPPEIGRLANLQKLSLSMNHLSGLIPREIGDLKNLQSLTLNENQLSGPIPSAVSNLKKLDTLWLGANPKLTCWETQAALDWALSLFSYSGPTGICNLSFLPLVYGIEEQPEEWVALMALYNSTRGEYWANKTGWFTDDPYCEWYGVTCNSEGYVSRLDLNGNHLNGSLPAEIGKLVNLQILNLSFNRLPGPIPPEIGDLVNLQSLDLNSSRLEGHLPAEMGKLVNLQSLNLWQNHLLGAFPPEFGELVNLQSLDLGYNQLTSLPPEIGKLVNLQILDLSSNQLSSLPPEIGNLANLDSLYLYGNQITYLPPEIGYLVNLQWLDLDFNQLTDPVPAALSGLSNLSGLFLDHNPDLTCWETQEALAWALSLREYAGPSIVCGPLVFLPLLYGSQSE